MKVRLAARRPESRRSAGNTKCSGPSTARSSSGLYTEIFSKALSSDFSRCRMIPDLTVLIRLYYKNIAAHNIAHRLSCEQDCKMYLV